MKKKLSLAVAGLMVLTLAPVNTFALKTEYSSIANVEENDGKATFSGEFEFQAVDVAALRPGTVTVQLLGEDVEYDKNGGAVVDPASFVATIGSTSYSVAAGNLNIDGSYATLNVTTVPAAGDKLIVTGKVKFDGAKDGEYEVAYDLSGIGLSKYVRKYAKLVTTEGTFVKATETKKAVGRGLYTGARFEVINSKAAPQDVVLTLPSDFVWNTTDTKVFPTAAVAYVTDASGPIKNKVKFTIPANGRVFVTPSFVVPKGTTVGDYESVVVAEYVDYAVKMELKKALQEVLANGDSYKVELVVKTSDKADLPKYVDFELEGGKAVVSGGVTAGTPAKPVDEFTAVNAGKELKLKLELTPDWDKDGEVVLKAKGRGMDDLSLVVLKVQPVAKMSVVQKEVLGGDAKVLVNDIVIKETKATALKPGQRYAVTLTGLKFANDVKFDAKGKLEAEGIKVKDLTVDKKYSTLYFTVDTRSKKDAPATITLKDVEIVSDRSLPFGDHQLTFAKVADDAYTGNERGKALLVEKRDVYELLTINKADFIKVVDKVSKVKKTTVFTLGSADYTVEGVAMKLDTPVFTQDNYTMLPVRAIAEALGVDVVWNQDNLTATFIDGDIVVSVTQNAKVLYKNGNQYPMTTKATVKADRMFIPVSSVGDAFGLTRDYDYTYSAATRQVTIYPKKEAVKPAEEVKPEVKPEVKQQA